MASTETRNERTGVAMKVKTTKRRSHKPSVPVDYSCKVHKVKAPAECVLCRDQMQLWETEEA
jgi:hypothetical protein